MATVEQTSFAIEDIKPLIGVRVLAGKAALLGGGYAEELREMLETRGVLVFPQVDMSEAELIAFTRTLGEYATDIADGSATRISIDPASSSNADYTRASFFWHFDGYMNDVPIRASIMCAKQLSEEGGNTEFCNTYAAYDELPAAMKQRIAGLQAVHSHAAAQISVEPEPSHDRFRQWLEVRSNILPLVWTHRSGRKSLVIGNTAVGIPGMDLLESMELLIELRDWATQERFRYAHHWSPGDMVMWDNTGTLHRVTSYPANSGRLMIRTKLAGEEPVV